MTDAAAASAQQSWNSTLLSKDEFDQLAASIRDAAGVDALTKLVRSADERIEKLTHDVAQQKSELEAYELYFEEKSSDIENKSKAVQRDNDSLKQQLQQMESERTRLQERISTLSDEIERYKRTESEHKRQMNALQTDMESLKEDKNQILCVVTKKDAKIAQLDDEIAALNKKLVEQRDSKRELEEKLNDAQAAHVPLQYTIDKLKNANEALEKQNQWLNEQLQNKSRELVSSKNDLESQIAKLQNQVAVLNDEIVEHKGRLHSVQLQKEEIESRYQDTLQRFKDIQNNKTLMEDSLNRTILEKEKLANLYKEELQEIRIKSAELQDQLMDQATQHRTELKELQSRLDSQKQAYGKLAEERDELAQQLDSERRQRALAERAEPSVLAQNLIAQGVSTSDIYSQYSRINDEVIKLRVENRSLSQSLDEILKELEEKAPIITRQREEYDRLILQHQTLQKHHDKLEGEVIQVRHELTTLRMRTEQLQKENKAAALENDDLSRQIRRLLDENVQLHRGGASASSAESASRPQAIMGEYVDSNVIISQNLVEFKDIEDLQMQNRKLLQTIRALSAEREQDEQRITQNLNEGFERKLKHAIEQIETMKRDRQQQETSVLSIIKQRDMLSATIEEMKKSGKYSALPPSQSSTGAFADHAVSPAEERKQLQELKDIHKDLIKDRKMLIQENESLRNSIISSEKELAKLKAEQGHHADKVGQLQTMIDIQRKELDNIKEYNRKLTATNESLQANLNASQREIADRRAQLEKAENELKNVTAERNYHKERTEKLLQDIASLKKDREQEEKLFKTMQQIQIEMERQSSEVKKRAESDMDNLRSEINQLKKDLADERNLNKELQLTNSLKNQETEQKLENKEKELGKLNAELAQTKATLDAVRQDSAKLQERLSSTEQRLNTTIDRQIVNREISMSADTHELQVQVAKLQNAIDLKDEQVQQERLNSQHLKELVDQRSKSLQELQQSFDQYKQVTQDRVHELEQQLQQARTEMEQVRSAAEEKLREAVNIRDQYADQQETLIREKQDIDNKRKEAQENAQSSGERIRILTDDVKRHYDMWQRAQRDYEEEVVRHADSVKQREDLKKKLDAVETQLEEAKARVVVFESRLASQETSWNEQRQALEGQIGDYEQRIQDLHRQNEILSSQIETVRAQARKLEDRTVESTASASGEAASADTAKLQKEISELRELVTYLRRDKQFAESKTNIAEQNAKKFQQQYEFAQSELHRLQVELKSLQDKTKGSVPQSEAQYKELMIQVEQLTLYRESNKTLRQEIQELNNQLEEARKINQEQSSSVDPLKQQVRSQAKEIEALNKVIEDQKTDLKRWQERVRELLDKYKQIDPEEHRVLQEKLSQTEQERDSFKTENEELKKQMETAKQSESAKEALRQQVIRLNKMVKEEKARVEQLEKEKSALQTRNEQLEKEKSALENQTENQKKTQLVAFKQQKTKADLEMTEIRKENEQLKADNEQLRAKVEFLDKKVEKKDEGIEKLKKAFQEKKDQNEQLTKQIQTLRAAHPVASEAPEVSPAATFSFSAPTAAATTAEAAAPSVTGIKRPREDVEELAEGAAAPVVAASSTEEATQSAGRPTKRPKIQRVTEETHKAPEQTVPEEEADETMAQAQEEEHREEQAAQPAPAPATFSFGSAAPVPQAVDMDEDTHEDAGVTPVAPSFSFSSPVTPSITEDESEKGKQNSKKKRRGIIRPHIQSDEAASAAAETTSSETIPAKVETSSAVAPSVKTKAENEGKHWTSDDERQLKELHSNGTSLEQMAEKLGRSKTAVQRRITLMKLKPASPEHAPEQAAVPVPAPAAEVPVPSVPVTSPSTETEAQTHEGEGEIEEGEEEPEEDEEEIVEEEAEEEDDGETGAVSDDDGADATAAEDTEEADP